MNEREKKLLTMLAVALLAVLSMYGYKTYTQTNQELETQLDEAMAKHKAQEMMLKIEPLIKSEQEWLAKISLKPKSEFDAQTELKVFADQAALRQGLNVNKGRSRLPEPDKTSPHFHRAKAYFEVQGKEEALYKWIDQLNAAEKLRAVTSLNLVPNGSERLEIKAKVTVEQWYVPEKTEDSL